MQSTYRDSKHLTEFFKGIAILLVLLTHSHQKFNLMPICNAIQRFGQMGCQIFFVLSSFGLCHSYSNEKPKWIVYMRKRLSKIAIGYWMAIFIYAIYHIIKAILTHQDILSTVNLPGILINILFLNGLVSTNGINNTVVRGGWYIGTAVILYAVFPVLFKIYFEVGDKKWKKCRNIVFPLTLLLIATTTIIVAGIVNPAFACGNNTFVYFSFVNQLTPFSLGIVLFEISKRFYKNRIFIGAFILCLLITMVLFFGDFTYSFVFCPTFAALAFTFLYLAVINNEKICEQINNPTRRIVKIVRSFGRISFSIYLSHAFIVYEFSTICLTLLTLFYHNDLLWYMVLLPVQLYLVWFTGKIHNKTIIAIQTKCKKKQGK